MKENETKEIRQKKNFESISPSAKAILLMKGYTQLPFAKKAAELVMQPGSFSPDFQNKDFLFWARVLHFESRYKSVDFLLQDLQIKNMLELSSGFSFRCLDWVMDNSIHYIDTDLPDIITKKKEMLVELMSALPATKGQLELLPLDVLDEDTFVGIINHFEPGPLIILNEGLLVYLEDKEKRKLCRTIHAVLKERGGFWVTADIYLKPPAMLPEFKMKDDLQPILDRHNVDEKMFDSIESAKSFFESEGFVIDKEADTDYSQLDSLKYLRASASPEILEKMGHAPKTQTTWRLKVAD